jgi:hypothetical protein
MVLGATIAALAGVACVKAEERPVTLVFATRSAPDVAQAAASAVRIRVDDGQSSYLRSGVMIDPRGYVLTSFSSVGVEGISENRGSYSRPGTLYDSERVHVEVYDGPFSSTPAVYLARVVRGDVRLNLALLRIVGTLDGALPPDHRFAAIGLAGAVATPRLGSSGLAIGAGANVPSLTVRPGTLIAGIRNSQDQIAGYLIDLYHVTLDGAPYFDGDGTFAGVLSRGFLRPPERVPAEWLDALSRGDLHDLRVDGVDRLEPGVWAEVDLIGDSPYRPSSDESRREVTEDFYYMLPNLQAGTIVTVPAVGIVAYRGGRSIASGTGEVFVAGEADVMVAVRMPSPNDPRGLRLRVRFEPLR